MKLTAVIEWPKGSRERWEWREGRFVRKTMDLPAPVNYGFLPGFTNPADGEEVDVVVLGRALPAKSRIEAPLAAMLWLDDGDHKLVLNLDEGEHHSDKAALLAWFEPERRARLEDASAAAGWLKELGYP